MGATGRDTMRKINDLAAHNFYVLDLASFALLGDFGAYWLGSCSSSVAQAARWVRPRVVG